MKLAAWVLICIGFGMAEDPTASSSTNTTRPSACSMVVNIDVNSTGRYFSSDYYPGYPNTNITNLDCTWKFRTVDPGSVVRLEFNQTSIDYSETCNTSVVRVHDGHNSSSPLLLESCGPNTPSPITTNGNIMFVQFQTFMELQNQGIFARAYQLPATSTITTSVTTTTTITTTTTTITTTSAPKGTSGRVYNFGNNIELSFETIAYIIGGISIFLLLIICLVACCHKFSKKKMAAKVSRLDADQQRSHLGVGPRHIKVAPMPDTDSYPNPPDKLISKSPRSPRSPRNDNAGTASVRSAKAKAKDVEEVKRQSLSSGSGKQNSPTIPDDNLTPVGNRGTKSREKSSPSKDKRSPRVSEKSSPKKDKRSPRVPAARRATDGLL